MFFFGKRGIRRKKTSTHRLKHAHISSDGSVSFYARDVRNAIRPEDVRAAKRFMGYEARKP